MAPSAAVPAVVVVVAVVVVAVLSSSLWFAHALAPLPSFPLRALLESDVLVEGGNDLVIAEGDDVNGSDTMETASAAALISALASLTKSSISASGWSPRRSVEMLSAAKRNSALLSLD